MPLNALMMPTTVPNSPTNGRGGTDGRQAADAALQFGVHDGFGAFESALGSFDLFTRNFGAQLMSLEFLQTGHDNLGQMALVVAVGNLDGFVQLAFAQRAGNGRSELARLLARAVIGDQAVDHDADGPGRHEEQNDDDGFGRAIPSGPTCDAGSKLTRLLPEGA